LLLLFENKFQSKDYTSMRAVIQRVTSAAVSVDGEQISRIGHGLLCLIGIREGDSEQDAEYVARKILNIRLWPSEKKAWDQNVQHQDYEILCVSQFTLFGRLKGGNKGNPDFSRAMGPQAAREFYSSFVDRLRHEYDSEKVKDGVFGAMMQVELVNDGPVTFILDSENPSGSSVASSLDQI
jgi:D-aminoacyl-tRNA deacylase